MLCSSLLNQKKNCQERFKFIILELVKKQENAHEDEVGEGGNSPCVMEKKGSRGIPVFWGKDEV
jgi:hypothetical protein